MENARLGPLLVLLLLLAPAASAQSPPATPAASLRVAPFQEGPFVIEAGRDAAFAFRVVNAEGGTRHLVFAAEVGALPALAAQLDVTLQPMEATIAVGEAVDVLVTVVSRGDATGEGELLFRVFDEGYFADTRVAMVVYAPAPVFSPAASQSASPAAPALTVAAIGGAIGAGILLAWRRWRDALRMASGLALVPLYSRLARNRILDQRRRDELHRLIEAEPGIHFADILRATGLGSGVAAYHLRTLEQHGLVRSVRDGALRRYALTMVVMPARPPPPLTPMQQRVMDMLVEGPRTQRQIAEALGLSQQGANRHVKALERRGALSIRYEDGAWLVHAAEPASPARAPPARSRGAA